MCQCNGTGKIVTYSSNMALFQPCRACDVNENNREKAEKEIDEMIAALKGCNHDRSVS